MPGAADLDLPVTDRSSDEVLSIPVRPSLTDDELGTVVAAVREVATPSGERPDQDRGRSDSRACWHAGRATAAAGRAGRPRHDGPQPPPGNLVARDDATLVAVADPVAAASDAGHRRRSARQGFADPLAMLAEADARRARSIAAPTTLHCDLAIAAIDRRHRGARREAAGRRRSTRALGSSPRAAERGVPVQVGHVERFNPAVLELGELLAATAGSARIYGIRSRRAGPFPARIRDVGVTIDLATHDVDILSLDRRRAAGPRLRRDRPAASTRRTRTCCSACSTSRRGAVGMLDVELAHARRSGAS